LKVKENISKKIKAQDSKMLSRIRRAENLTLQKQVNLLSSTFVNKKKYTRKKKHK